MSRRSFWPAALVCLALAAVPAWAALGLSDRVLALEDRASVDPRGTIVELQRLRGEAVGAEQVQLLVLLGATLDFDGDPEGAQAVALALEGVDDPSAASAALMLRARLMLTRGTADRALKLARAAQAALPAAAPPWLRLHLAATLADAQSAAGRADEAIRHQLQTIELADQDGHARYRANTRRHLAWRYLTLGQLERARVLVAEAVALADPLRWPIVHAQALQLEGFVLLDMGQRDAAFTRLQMALSLSREAHSPVWEAQMLANLADYHLRSGEYQEAEAVAERALPMARAQKDPQMESVALANRGLARVMLGRVADGRRDLADALAIDERMGDVSSMAQTLLETGQYLERAGEHDAAWQAYVKLRPLSQQVDQAEQQKAILRLQEDFDQRQRERELRLLEQEAALNEAVLAKQRLRLSIGWLAAAAALLVLGLTVLLARRVRHANRALSDVNAELLALSERDPRTGRPKLRRATRHRPAQARQEPQ